MTANDRFRGNASQADLAAEIILQDSKGHILADLNHEANKQILATVIYTDVTGVPQSTTKTTATPLVHTTATVVARAVTAAKFVA